MQCPHCSRENPAGQSYCGHCGTHLVVNEGAEEPYYSWTFLGVTTTLTRTAYWTYYGLFLVIFAIPIGLAFEGYVLSGQTGFLGLGVGLILLWPVLLGIAVYRARAYRRRREKQKGV